MTTQARRHFIHCPRPAGVCLRSKRRAVQYQFGCRKNDGSRTIPSSESSCLRDYAPAPHEGDGDAVEVCGRRQTDDGREEACRERGKAEGEIALDEISRQQASAFARLS